MSFHALLNLSNDFRKKKHKMLGLPSIALPFRNELNRARMSDYFLSYCIKITLKPYFWPFAIMYAT